MVRIIARCHLRGLRAGANAQFAVDYFLILYVLYDS